jgi:16S rRNA (cytosine967-C5)-methyltransferase
MTLRLSATLLLDKVQQGGSLNALFENAQSEVDESDRAFFRELVYGSLRLWPMYKGVTRQLLEKPLKARDSALEALLILALYELDECSTPPYASVSAAVEVCASLKRAWAAKLINACLRRYQREKTVLLEQLGESEQAALPGWLYKVLKKHYPDDLNGLAKAGRHKPPLTLRVNSQKSSRNDYMEQLSSAGIEAIPVGAYGLTLSSAVPVSQIPGFSQGVVSVQDESAQLAGALIAGASEGAGAHLGIRVLDVCSAPGSKACHLAELGAEVTAMDVSASRLARVEENTERLGLTIKTLVGDGRELGEIAEENAFDLVLLDVPCSATGVMRRNPDVKVIRLKSDINQFAELQQGLLESAWRQVRPRGRLLYITCSLLPAENEDIVSNFLAVTADAKITPLSASFGIEKKVGRQTLPSVSGGDGLYYCMLEKIA